MLFGRPLNLWTGLLSAVSSTGLVLIVTLRPDVDAAQAATVIGSLTALLGVFIAFLAGQPPTVNQGDTVNVVTPKGQENTSVTV